MSDHLQEPVQRGRVAPVTEQRLLAGLTRPLVDHAELVVVHQHVLVVVDQELAGAGAQHRLQGGQAQLGAESLDQERR